MISTAGNHKGAYGCPTCGTAPTATQYVLYPKFHKVRCRGCKTPLIYVYPLWKKVLIATATAVAMIVGLLALVVLEVTHGLPFAPWAIALIVVVTVLFSYIEAIHVQKNYPPVKA